MSREPDREVQTICLPSGRTLGYAEYGDPGGEPLFYFHGFPGSRLEAVSMDKIALRLRIRMLSVDRPGFGLSTHDPQRRIGDWPRDVLALAEQLGVLRFAIMGMSGGGPYALACAKEISPTVLTAVGVVAGTPMWDRGVRSEGYLPTLKLGYLGAKYWPLGMRIIIKGFLKMTAPLLNLGLVKRILDAQLAEQIKIRTAKGSSLNLTDSSEKSSVGTVLKMQTQPIESTKESYLKSKSLSQIREEHMRASLQEPFAQGAAGFVHEMQLLTQDWGFQYEDILYNHVQIWQGTRDKNVPPAMVRAMAGRIPHCVLIESDDTHFTILRGCAEILNQIMSFRSWC